MREMTHEDHARTAAVIDPDDPFILARLMTHATNGVGRTADYSRTRRQPALLGEAGRVRLTQKGATV